MTKALQKAANEVATKLATQALLGAGLEKLTYYLTGWELVFLTEKEDIHLRCSDIEVPKTDRWWSAIANLPIDIGSCHDRDDIIVAMLLTSNLRRHNVSSAIIQNEGDIHLEFENGVELIIKGRCDPVDWTWDLLTEKGDFVLKCEFGEVFAPGINL